MAINTTNMIPDGLEFNKMRYRMEDKKALGGMNYKVYTGDDSEIDGENRVYYTKGEEIGIVLSNWFWEKKSISIIYPEDADSTVSIVPRIKIGTEETSVSNTKGISIGYKSSADVQTSIAIGNNSSAKANNAVQIGKGSNGIANTLKFIDKTIVSYDSSTNTFLINADTAKTAKTANNATNADKVNNIKFDIGSASGYSFTRPIVAEYEYDNTQFKSYIKQYKMIYNNNNGEPITTSGVTINGLPSHTRSNDLVFYFRVGSSSSDNSSILKAYYSPNAANWKQVLLYGVYDVNANLSTDGEITLSISQAKSKAIYLFKIESVSQGITL